jgi:hypothetical protein
LSACVRERWTALEETISTILLARQGEYASGLKRPIGENHEANSDAQMGSPFFFNFISGKRIANNHHLLPVLCRCKIPWPRKKVSRISLPKFLLLLKPHFFVC